MTNPQSTEPFDIERIYKRAQKTKMKGYDSVDYPIDEMLQFLDWVRSRTRALAPAAPAPATEPGKSVCDECDECTPLCPNDCGAYYAEKYAAIRKAEREQLKPFINFARTMETKNREMADLMKKNGMKIDNLDDPMQKLAFTFYSEIAEISHTAENIIKEYEESLRIGGAP